VFFGRGCWNTLGYATLDNAGGEKVRAARKSLSDLEVYLSSPELRDLHREKWENGEYGSSPLDPIVSFDVDLEWLRIELMALEELRQICVKAERDFEYGVLYAVRIQDEDLAQVSSNGFMGLEVTGRIPADRILAKMLIPRELDRDLAIRGSCVSVLRNVQKLRGHQ